MRHIAWLAILLSLAISGCATTSGQPDPRDPYEGFNRAMFKVNETLDKAIKPAAQAYEKATPLPIRTGIKSFFANAGDLMIAVNNGLQGKGGSALSDLSRLLINSTLGIFGLFDVASEMGIEKHNEDFGQTLAVWGVGDGPYVFLPIFGPRTLRDTFALPVDYTTRPLPYLLSADEEMAAMVLGTLDTRVSLFPAEKVMQQAATDKYSYLKNAYLQRRKSLVYDGNPPRPKYEDFE